MSPSVLVTGPTRGIERYAAAARRAGWEPALFPLIRIEQRAVDLASQIEGIPDWICVTSANAIPALEPHLASWSRVPCASVGPRTARRLRELGFRVEVEGGEGAAELAELLAPRLEDGARVLWPRGSLAGELAAILRRNGVDVRDPVVYATHEGGDEHEPAATEAIFLASPSAARACVRRWGPDRRRFELAVAIGPTTREALGPETAALFATIVVLPVTTPEALEETLRARALEPPLS